MRILIAADPHIHPHPMFDKRRPYSERLMDGLSALLELGVMAADHAASHLVIAGDLFHKRHALGVRVFNAVYDVVEQLADMAHIRQIDLLSGNHDQSSYDDVALHAFRGIHKVRVHTEPGVDRATGLHYVPYRENPEDWYADVDGLLREDPNPLYLIAHQSVYGAKRGTFEYCPPHSVQVRRVPDAYRMVFAGHYHPHQLLEERWLYVGSLLPLDRSDRGLDKCAVVLDTKTHEWWPVYTDYPAFVEARYPDGPTHQCKGNFVDVYYPFGMKERKVQEWADSLGARSYWLQVDQSTVPEEEAGATEAELRQLGAEDLVRSAIAESEGEVARVGSWLLGEALSR